jgi:hypothetical protein
MIELKELKDVIKPEEVYDYDDLAKIFGVSYKTFSNVNAREKIILPRADLRTIMKEDEILEMRKKLKHKKNINVKEKYPKYKYKGCDILNDSRIYNVYNIYLLRKQTDNLYKEYNKKYYNK